MAQATFHKDFNFSDMKKGISWRVNASLETQSFPQRVIDAAIEAGAATIPETKKKKTKE